MTRTTSHRQDLRRAVFVGLLLGLLSPACGGNESATQPLDIVTPGPFDIVYPDIPVTPPPNDTEPGPDLAVLDDVAAEVADDVVAVEDSADDAALSDTALSDTAVEDIVQPTDTIAEDVAQPTDTTVADVAQPTDTTATDVAQPTDTAANDVAQPTDTTADVVCTPSCPPNTCGSNGCGGTCSCTTNQTCNPTSFVCEAIPTPGNTCANPLALTSDGAGGFTGTGNLTAAGITDSQTLGTCPRLDSLVTLTGQGTPDMAFRFTAPATRRYRVAVTSNPSSDAFFALYTGTVCGSSQCVGYVDNGVSGGTDAREFELTANTAYTLIVDTWTASSAGGFSIAVTPVCVPNCAAGCGLSDGCGGTCGCGAGLVCNTTTNVCGAPPVAGNTCAAPIALTANGDGSFSGAGDLRASGVTDNVSRGTCTVLAGYNFTGAGTPDLAFSFTPATTRTYAVAVTSASGVDSAYTLYRAPGCSESNCLGGVDNGFSGGTDTYTFALTAGQAYTLVVDSYSNSFTGAFTVAVTPVACTPQCGSSCGGPDGCGGVCGCAAGLVCSGATSTCVTPPPAGDTCENAIVLETMLGDPKVLMGVGDISLTSLTNALDPRACEQVGFYSHSGQSTRDQVFRFVATESGSYSIGVFPDDGVDIAFMLYDALPCAGASCLGYLDDGDSSEVEAASVDLIAGETVYIAVDSFSNTIAPGPFTVIVLLPSYVPPPE